MTSAGGDGGAMDLHPVSPGQRSLWLLHRGDPDGAGAAYTIAAAGRVRGPFDPEACRRAFAVLVERHPALRTVFPEASDAPVDGGEGPVQRVLPEAPPGGFERIDASEASGWTEEEVPERLAELAYRPFDLERGPLFRVAMVERRPEGGDGGSPEWLVLLALHHLVGDLWSLAVVVRELGRAYGALVEGREAASDLPPLATTHADWVRRRLDALEGPDAEPLWSFWRDSLGGPEPAPPLDLPTDRPRPPVQSFAGGLVARSLESGEGPGLRRDLGRLARRCGTNRFTALMAAYQVVLARWSGQDDFLVGSPTAGRGGARSELANVVGYFVNPVAVRSALRAEPEGSADPGGAPGATDPGFADLVTRLGRETEAALAHQELPFPWIAREMGEQDPSRTPLFQTMMVLQKSPLPGTRGLGAFALGREGAPLRLGALELESVPMPQQGAQFDLSLFVTDEEGELVGSLEYCSDLFDRATASRLLGHLANLLAAAVEDPERPVSELPMLTPEERRQLLEEWAVGGREPAGGTEGARSLHERFLARAAESPDAEALRSGTETLTYSDLERRSARAAAGLRELGVGPEVPVGVFLDRTPELMVALLGVLRTGGAYVPMDPAYPEERLELMVRDSGMPVAIAGEGLAQRLPGGLRVTSPAELDTASPAADGAGTGSDPDHLAYVIYTSGSTGRPKGVAITHRSAGALIDWAGATFDSDELSGVLAATSVCFDLSVFELFAPLTLGGRVILAPDALALPSLEAAGEVRLVNTVPSAMEGLCRAEEGGLPPSVRTACLAGEPLRRSLVDAVHGAGRVERVLNLYGPSEDTTYSTEALCPAGVAEEPTIGRVLPGGRAHVVDRHLRPVPQGVPGELLLGGVGLARGYLGRPDLTAERFVPDPFAEEVAPAGGPGARLYRTGDLVRWLPGGELQFLGRLDHQVKLRGFRIELGEVETALEGHPDVREVVAVVSGEGAERRLVAYLAPEEGRSAPGIGDLRGFLGRRLPGYMVPDVFVELEALPRTPNGKVDRKALPEPAGGRAGVDEEYVAPETEVEQILAEMWQEVLGVDRVGIHDSFFELGGHSLSAHQILVRVRETFGVEVPVPRLFEQPTIAGLSVAIAEALVEGLEEEDVAEVLGSLE